MFLTQRDGWGDEYAKHFLSLYIAKNITLYPINMHICIDLNMKKLSNKYLKSKYNRSDKMIHYQKYCEERLVLLSPEYVSGDFWKGGRAMEPTGKKEP